MKPTRNSRRPAAQDKHTANPLRGKRLEALRTELLAAKARIEGRRSAIERDIGRTLSADSKEQAVELENAEVLDRLREDAESRLPAIDQALARLDEGNYGICATCAGEIPIERLIAFPQASNCIACAREQETARRG